jgi:hypothetical protein
LRIPTVLHDGLNEPDFAGIAAMSWVLVLEYQDVFGKVFHTRHAKDPRTPWTVFGEGSAPLPPEPSAAQVELTRMPAE